MTAIQYSKCPFCAENTIGIDSFMRTGHIIFHAKCMICGACGPEAPSEEISIRHWNQRIG